jgi:3',5'-cyclic AMP phosphodiesterase CpdA
MSALRLAWATRTVILCCFAASGCGDDSASRIFAPDGAGLASDATGLGPDAAGSGPDSAEPGSDGGVLGPDGGAAAPDGGAEPPLPNARLLVLSDPHYFDLALGTTGSAFAAEVSRDRKLIAESDAIMRAMVAAVQAEDPRAVLISGDLTKDGERTSHLLAAAYLRQMQTGGRKVFVVPGDHDVQNANAESYSGDVRTPVSPVSAGEFAAIYADMGYASALARDPASLSYLAEIVPGLWLLALDSCTYGDAPAVPSSAGHFSDATRTWIQTQLAQAQGRGQRVLAMMHHGVLEHFTGQALVFSEYVVTDRDAVASLLSNGGVGAVFTGHFHAHDITRGLPSGATKSIYDLETGSTVTYPCPYRIVDVAADTWTVTSKRILTIDYDLKDAPDFQTYAYDNLRSGLEPLLTDLLGQPPYSMTADRAGQIAPWVADGLLAHYAGDEVMPADVPAKAQSLLLSGSTVEVLVGLMLQNIWTDLAPADNAVTIDLAAR